MISTVFSSIPFEMMLAFAIVAIAVMSWGFVKLKKEHPNECSRYIILSFIPLICSCTVDAYYRHTQNISDMTKTGLSAAFKISSVIFVATIAIVTYISYKQKNEYYETLKRRKPILLTCGIGVAVCIVICLLLKYFCK